MATIFAFVATQGIGNAAPPATLTSPPVDVSMFREGEVKRTSHLYGGWILVCDEISRLHHRYCSLSADLRDGMGSPLGNLVISTGDDGRPAALLRVPMGVSLRGGVVVSIEPSTPTKTNPILKTAHPFFVCAQKACAAIWNLAASDIVALNKGAALRVHYQRVVTVASFSSSMMAERNLAQMESVIPGGGFADAIAASIQPVN